MFVTKWLIESNDRVGMILDIVSEFSQQGVNITKMEVNPGQMFIKFFLSDENITKKMLYDRLLDCKDVKEIKDIDLLPYRKKEKELQTVIESVNNGIIGLTSMGYIKYFNRTILEYFNLSHDEVYGLHINQLTDGKAAPIFNELLAGCEFHDYLISTTKGNYICSGKPVLNQQNQVIDAVVTFKSVAKLKCSVKEVTNDKTGAFDNIIHSSPVIENVVSIATKVANSRYTVLIKGETGTGKELFARAIHNASERRNYAFSPINCAALPEALLESELFGYEGGAFTGASRAGKKGLFESTNNGTIFFDEFGELSLSLQSKLLRVLQDNVIRRVGGTKYIPVDVRIIVATNRNLEEMVEQQQFRQDLFYRINIIPIDIPPLRNRKEDIPLILDYFLDKYCVELNKNITISQAAKEYLINYSWPGNVRELQNVILRAIHLCTNDCIDVNDLSIKSHCVVNSGSNLKQTIQNTEKDIIEKMLKQFGTARGVARAVGLSHTAVLKKIKDYDLEYLLTNRAFKN